MTSAPTQPPLPPLDPAACAAMQRATLAALTPLPGASPAEMEAQRADALGFLAALRPRDVLEAMLAVRIVATHYAALECFHRAAQGDLPASLHPRVVGRAVALCRLMDATLRELNQRQGGRQAQLPAGLVEAMLAMRAKAAPAGEGTAPEAVAPMQAPMAEGRHERRRRERAERHLAAAQRVGGVVGARERAMQERLVAAAAARAAAPGLAATA